MSILKWLNDKLSEGFYFPFMVNTISSLEKLCFNYRVGKHLREKITRNEKPPRWVSELYQCLFLVLGFLAFIFSEWIHFKCTSYLIIVFFSYRIFEISIFILAWIFVKKEELLHDYRRSISSFLVNIVEVATYFSIITIWSGGLKDYTKVNIFYKHVVGILTLSPPDTECTILSLVELFVSVFLILVIIGALVGALAREEMGNNKEKQ